MKKIKDLSPGETFVDSLGCYLTAEKVMPLPWLGIPRTSPQVRVYFVTEAGNRMFCMFRADRVVAVVAVRAEGRK